MPMMHEKQHRHVFFLALQKKVLIHSMYFANYSKSKNMWVGNLVCIKRFEFACMTVLMDSSMSMYHCGYVSATCSKAAQDG